MVRGPDTARGPLVAHPCYVYYYNIFNVNVYNNMVRYALTESVQYWCCGLLILLRSPYDIIIQWFWTERINDNCFVFFFFSQYLSDKTCTRFVDKHFTVEQRIRFGNDETRTHPARAIIWCVKAAYPWLPPRTNYFYPCLYNVIAAIVWL